MSGERIIKVVEEQIIKEPVGDFECQGGYRDGYGDTTHSDYDDSWHEDIE